MMMVASFSFAHTNAIDCGYLVEIENADPRNAMVIWHDWEFVREPAVHEVYAK